MITISCPNCGKNYFFDETKVPDDIEMLECKICKSRFPFEREPDPFKDPFQELPLKEEGKLAEVNVFSELFPTESKDEVEPLELWVQTLMPDEEQIPPSPIDAKGPIEDPADPEIESSAEVQLKEDCEGLEATFCAEKFRMLNAKNKNKERRIILYGLFALGSFIFLCYVIYSGR